MTALFLGTYVRNQLTYPILVDTLVKCLYIAADWPLPKLSAAGRRTYDLLSFMKFHLNAEVIIACHKPLPAQWHEFASSHNVIFQKIELNRNDFDQWLLVEKPNLVIFDRFMTEEQYGWRVLKVLPMAIRILDTQDWHALRAAREQVLISQYSANAPKKMPLEVDATLSSKFERELLSMLRSSATLFISQSEIQYLKRQLASLGIDVVSLAENTLTPSLESEKRSVVRGLSEHRLILPVLYFPFVHNLKTLPKSADYSSRKHMVFVGNFLHRANIDALAWLQETIWPRIRASLPDVECHIYGAFCESKHQKLNDPSNGLYLKGAFEGDATVLLQHYRLNLAPLRFGAGLKGKVFEAALYGTPSMMTPIASEGLFSPECTFGCEETAGRFAQQAIVFYEEEHSWSALRKHQQEHIFNNFHQQKPSEAFLSVLKGLDHSQSQQGSTSSLLSHISPPFVQRLLNQQSMKANTYFSRWIELKETQLLTS